MNTEQSTPLVRWATDDESAACRELRRRTWHVAYAAIYTPDEIDGMFDGRLPFTGDWIGQRREPVGTLVAVAGATIVGLASLVVHRDEGEGDGEVAAFYVLPAWQGRGIGLALWDAALAALRDRGCARMQVWTLARNLPARRFYERRGGVADGEGISYIGDHGEPEVRYRIGL